MAGQARRAANKGVAGVKGMSRGSVTKAKGASTAGNAGTQAGKAAKRTGGRQSGY
jgi:hypothetical protein